MTDKEMILFLYGALKAMVGVSPEVITRVEAHLYPLAGKMFVPAGTDMARVMASKNGVPTATDFHDEDAF